MRPAFERVRRDTRRPPIPDLPLREEEDVQQEKANDIGRGLAWLSGVVVAMLLFAVVMGLYGSRPFHQSVATTHLSTPADPSLH